MTKQQMKMAQETHDLRRLFDAGSGYRKRVGDLPYWIEHLGQKEATKLLEVANCINLYLKPGHLAWWLSRDLT